MKAASVVVYNLGRISHQRGLDIQSKFVRRSLEALANGNLKDIQDVLLLMQLNPVYTVGLRRKDYTIKDKDKLKTLGAEFHQTNRGGLITFHGPGQLVAYPIMYLKNYPKMTVRCYIDALQNVLVNACAEFGVIAGKTEDPGAWVGDRKIGAVGVNVRRYVSQHGVSLNCDVDLSWFEHIVPCGIPGKKVTSLSSETNRHVTVDDIIEPFSRAFQLQFNCYLKQKDLDESHNSKAIS